MKAFVTGSTGLLGSNLVRQLVQQGHTVVALARSPQKARAQLGASPHVTVVQGDLESIDGFAAHLSGCDVLFHTAAYFREYYGDGDHWAKLEQLNVHGTIKLLDAAERAGVKKVIYVSSSGVIGAPKPGQPGDESTPPDATALRNLYFKSKVLAETAVFEWLNTHTLPVVLILPTWMHGPGDAAPTSAGQMVRDHLVRKHPAVPAGGTPVVDARDVAAAMINAVARGRSGERYIVNNRYVSLPELTRVLEQVSGVPAPRIQLPYPMAITVAFVAETIARLRKQSTLLTVNGIRTLQYHHELSSAKAMHELGATFRPIEDTLRDSVSWQRANAPG